MKLITVAFALILFTGCSTYPSMPTVDYVDIPKFMGKWYVIANIPTFIEKGAHNAVEEYKLEEDGSIATTFTFRQDSFTGELNVYNPIGYITNKKTNATWGMQFIWPFKADYRVIYLDDKYMQTVIGRQKRDYVWIMARTPSIPESDYKKIIKVIEDAGYDTSLIQLVPQKWPQASKETTP